MATPADLESFATSVTCPDDFDQFWTQTLTQLSEIPLDPTATPDPLRSNPEADVYQATYRSLDDLKIFGWYTLPAQPADNGPYPAILLLPGYKSEPALRRDWGRKGVAVLSVAVRGKLPSSAQFNPGYPGLLTHGIESRETYAYRGVISDCSPRPRLPPFPPRNRPPPHLRLRQQPRRRPNPHHRRPPPRNPRRRRRLPLPLLLPRIHPNAPLSYPYDEISCYLRAHPQKETQTLQTLQYYDAVNFAPRIQCPTAVGIALDDEVCPPETGYAAYAQLNAPRELWLFPPIRPRQRPRIPKKRNHMARPAHNRIPPCPQLSHIVGKRPKSPAFPPLKI